MRMLRRTATVAVMGLAVSGLAQAAARADDAPITIQSASTAPDNNGKFDVALTSTSDVASITATLTNVATQQQAATVTDFTLTSGTATDGQWEPAKRVVLPDLGSYRIDLTVTDTAGDTVTQAAAGYFYYQVQTLFRNVTVDRRSTDYAHQQVTISGQMVGRWPGTGAVSPVPDAGVYISNDGWEDNEPVTDADGDFTSTEAITGSGTLQAIFPYGNLPNYGSAYSTEIPIKLVQSATKVVLDLTSHTVPYQGSTTGGATFLWDSPTGWQPLAGKQVGVNGCGLQSVQFVTDAGGNIAIPSGGPLWSDCTLLAGWTSDDPYLKDASASTTVTVIQPASFSDFTAAPADANDPDDAGDVTVSGHLQFTGLATPGTPLVDVQYSATGKGGWTTVTTGLNAEWDGTGYAFSATLPAAQAGYWRAVFEPTKGFTNATSPVAYAAPSATS